MKEYQRLIGAIIIGISIIIAGVLVSNALIEAGSSIGSQIAQAINAS